MKWITRENVKVDRVACPWLIVRFIDPAAEFLFVPESELLRRAAEHEAIAFDPGRVPRVRLGHRGTRCTFDAILEDYGLSDMALTRLAAIVRAADVKSEEHTAIEAPGLRAIGEGFAEMGLSDQERLRAQFPVYDALYAYVKRGQRR